MRFLALTLLLSFSFAGFSGNKDGGNGQLVVIPQGETKPVPYEAVRAWETGKYRNFFRLPNINGNVEQREKFNKMYGKHALDWLEKIKNLSPKLHEDLIKAAEVTGFRIVNELITWAHEPYPEGELDYKTYEKAAFYNGEIILSTPIMDKVGPLSDVLTKDENQGFIVIHELINAAYPNFTVAQKLDIGEAIIQTKILKISALDFNFELCTVDPLFLKFLPEKNDFMDLVDELLKYEQNSSMIEFYRNAKVLAEQYAYSDENITKNFEKDVLNRKFRNSNQVTEHAVSIHSNLLRLGFQFKSEIVNFETLKNISKTLKLKLDLLAYNSYPIYNTHFQLEFDTHFYPEAQKMVMPNFEQDLLKVLMNENLSVMIEDYAHYLIHQRSHGLIINAKIHRLKSLNFPYYVNANGANFLNLTKLFIGTDDVLLPLILKAYQEALCARGVCVNAERTVMYGKWANSSTSTTKEKCPLKGSDKVILAGFHSQSNIVVAADLINVNEKYMFVTVKGGDGFKTYYKLPEWDITHDPFNLSRTKDINIQTLLILK